MQKTKNLATRVTDSLQSAYWLETLRIKKLKELTTCNN